MEITTIQVRLLSPIQGRPVYLLIPHGSLDASNYQELIAQAESLWQSGAGDYLIDLSAVHHMSSSGVMALHKLAMLLSDQSNRDETIGAGFQPKTGETLPHPHLILLNPSENVNRVLDIVGLKTYLAVYPTLELALQAFDG